MRHAQLPLSSAVLNAMAAATIAPMKYELLKRDVMIGRSFGYDNSPIMADPETIQKTIPKPRNMRAMMYIATSCANPWSNAPITMMIEPIMIAQRLPIH